MKASPFDIGAMMAALQTRPSQGGGTEARSSRLWGGETMGINIYKPSGRATPLPFLLPWLTCCRFESTSIMVWRFLECL